RRVEVAAVRAEGHPPDGIRMPAQGEGLAAGLHVPELDGSIFTPARGNTLAVRRERDREGAPNVAAQAVDELPGRHVPDRDFPLAPVPHQRATGGGQLGPVGAERHIHDLPPGMRPEGTEFRPAGRVPELYAGALG